MSDQHSPASSARSKAAQVARRVYLGPPTQTNVLRKGLRVSLLGLLTLSLLASPFTEPESTPDTAASESSVEATATASPSPSAKRSASPSPSPTQAAETSAPPASAEQMIAQADDDTALAVLGAVAVKGRAAKTGYDRAQFGPAWTDTDRNGCDTRNDILQRDLTDVTFRPGTNDCVVITGTLAGPYTGRTISFTKENADAVHVDHVVALSDAWQKGAQTWPAEKRLAFANDPLNLLAVDGPTNSSKSDGDAATWLPPNKAYRCAMVARQVAVKAKYELWMTAAERDATARVLSSCPNEPAPSGGNPTMTPVKPPPPPPPPAQAPSPPPPPAPAPAPPAPPPADPATDPDYGTCKKAKAAGKGPYYQGKDLEYGYYRDADSDGMVCE